VDGEGAGDLLAGAVVDDADADAADEGGGGGAHGARAQQLEAADVVVKDREGFRALDHVGHGLGRFTAGADEALIGAPVGVGGGGGGEGGNEAEGSQQTQHGNDLGWTMSRSLHGGEQVARAGRRLG